MIKNHSHKDYFSDKVIYQIYPKSFQDTDGDGWGDISGIIQRLDYLKYLGVDIIWLTPFFVSPQNDNGYDVADYYNIDQRYGTMQDFEKLVEEANNRNIGIMLDMVFNHTSTEHEWFKRAISGEEKYKNYYFFKKTKEGHLPTNWESKFGGPAWEYCEELDEYYLHLFDKTQADLNWKNHEVRNELIAILNFWLEKGVRGFRFDVVNLIDKVEFKDDLNGPGKIYYTDGEQVASYLHELNTKTFGNYENCITVGEMSATTIEKCAVYTNQENQILDMTFNFHHLKVDYENKEKWTSIPFDLNELKNLFHTWGVGMQALNGWNALFLNCHDQPRSLSRFGNDSEYHDQAAKMLATVTHLQRGTPYIYQGEEIGMTNAYFEDIKQYRDIESINYYQILKDRGIDEQEVIRILQDKSRDNARTPMQWTSQGGFTTGTPWLQMNDNSKIINVDDNLKNQNSILHYYKKLIELRKEYPAICVGKYIPFLEDYEQLIAFKRVIDNEEILVINNFREEIVNVQIDNLIDYSILLSNYQNTCLEEGLILNPYQTIILLKKETL